MVFEREGFRRLETLDLEDVTPRGAQFTTDAGPLAVEFYAPGILRLRFGAGGGPDYGVLAASPDAADVVVTRIDEGYRLTSDGLMLAIEQAPLRLRLVRDGETLLESTRDGHITGRLRLPPVARKGDDWVIALELQSGEPVYGLGEKFGPLNHRGQLVTCWNEDALGVNAELSYKNAPFAWSPKGWGVFVHTTARVQHGVGYPQWSHRSYILRVEEPTLDLFLLAAPTPAALLERYTHLTGRAPMPPLWSFGAWISRLSFRLPEEVLAVARKLRERRIPCDVFVLDGRVWLKVETRFHFEWDSERWPDPEAFLREIKGLGFHVCNWEYPYVSIHNPVFKDLAEKGYFLRTTTGETYVYHWDPEPFGTTLSPLPSSGMIDFTNPDAYTYWRDAHRKLFEMGVDVMKTDFGEQLPEDVVAHNGDTGKRLHNVYPLLYNRCVFEAAQRYSPAGAMVWGRSGWAGSQRFPIQWGGDPQTDWEALAASIRGSLSWGMSGVPFQTSDIGGFYGPMPDAELYVRWTQVGVLNSHTRFHGITPREPWEFGEEAESIVRNWLEWRYRLLPYLQACALEATHTGLPVLRAMALAFPDDPAAWGFEQQYLFGPSLLVAPVVRPGGSVEVYLPRGTWYDLWSQERLEGPLLLNVVAPLDHIPVYGRDGYLLPLGPIVQHTGELGGDVRIEELWVFGIPRHGMQLPGFNLVVEVSEQQTHLRHLPTEVAVHSSGNARLERVGNNVVFYHAN